MDIKQLPNRLYNFYVSQAFNNDPGDGISVFILEYLVDRLDRPLFNILPTVVKQ